VSVKGLKTYLKRDGLLLLGSLVLSVLVWNYVNDELSESRTVEVPLNLRVPEGLTVVSGAVDNVEVVLRGPRGRMASLDTESIAARFDIPRTSEPRSEVLVRLTERDFVDLPAGVELAQLPDGFTVVVELQERKRVPVRVQPVGNPAEGFAVIRAPRVEPGEVWVRGIKDKIADLEFLKTEEIDVGGRQESFSASVRLVAPSGVHCTERVLVVVEIGKPPIAREVANIPVKVLMPEGFKHKIELLTSTVTVQIYGDPQQVTLVGPRNVLAMVDVSRLAESEGGLYPLPVKVVKLPPGITLAPGTKEPRITVRLIK
jgi:YbbR domain-containing protein